MANRNKLFTLMIPSVLFGCTRGEPPASLVIDPAQTYQVIAGFGASDCWTANYVGRYWKEAEKEAIARYLFSQEVSKDGSPQGIGLSMWRFNLGAGTEEQGNDSGIDDISRRAESFLDKTYQLDFSKQAGQQWFLKKAQRYGVEQFVAFSNAPPIPYSRNGKGYSSGGGANLKDDAYDDFADYMSSVIAHFRDEGIHFSYLSPVNEPQYDWKEPTQEGSPWGNEEIKRLVIELDQSIRKQNLDTRILLSEAGKWSYLFQSGGRASGQIRHFFDPASPDYIGNLQTLAPVIGGHSYWTHDTDAQLRINRIGVQEAAKRYGLTVFQTEWSMLSAGEDFPGYEKASYMDIALFMAKIIHSDLTYTEAASWSFWTAMDMERWDHKNRFLLISLAPGNPPDPYTPITEAGTIAPRSTLWVLGNYSFFIRPGYQRIHLEAAEETAGLLGTAYIAPDQTQYVVVLVNLSFEEKTVAPHFKNMSNPPRCTDIYLTDEKHSLQRIEVPKSGALTVPLRSVVTVVYK